jgi:coenzyme F420-dependent glucose-6-phosphate dehydrogenase
VEMYGSRFWLAVGSGEALNETVTGGRWLPKPQRHARLEAAVEMMRALWAGHTVSSSGLVQAQHARLHVAIDRPPLLVGAALSVDTARWLARWADALITVAGERDVVRSVLDAFREGGGEGKPVLLQVALSYAPRQEDAERAAFEQWRQCALTSEQLADLRSPEEFDRATMHVSMHDVLTRVPASADIQRHVGMIEQYAALGVDRIYLHNVARDHQERFIEACASQLSAFGADISVSSATTL